MELSAHRRAIGGTRWYAIVLALALASIQCSHTTTEVAPAASASPIPEGRVAFRFLRLDGTAETIGTYRGRVVVIAVITTWAGPALLEVPELKEIYALHGRDDLEVVSVVLDDKPDTAKIFRQTFDIPYVVATVEDRAAFTGEDGPLGPIHIIPTSFLLDREGRIAARMEGTWPAGALREAVDELVRAK